MGTEPRIYFRIPVCARLQSSTNPAGGNKSEAPIRVRGDRYQELDFIEYPLMVFQDVLKNKVPDPGPARYEFFRVAENRASHQTGTPAE